MIFVVSLVLFSIFGAAGAKAQSITINTKSTTLPKVLIEIGKQSNRAVIFDEKDFDSKPVSFQFSNKELTEALDIVLAGQPVKYTINGRSIVVSKPKPATSGNNSQQQGITGKVVDDSNLPIPGVTIRLKTNPRKAVVTGSDGRFTLPLSSDGEVVEVSSIGFSPYEFTAKASGIPQLIKLKKSENKLDEIIVTGMMERKKSTFTGATSSFSGEQLKMVSNQSLIQSLRSVDPSFVFVENNSLGSNPNGLPTIELRGQSSISIDALQNEFSVDPNQPLFILDGFETTLRAIADLDMNIVSSVTILKDAASTAIYGSRASNGVVVVETIKPKQGKVTVSYATDLRVEMPDLSSYNMMNAAEKLEFERLSGRYISNDASNQPNQLALDNLYNKRLAEVNRGVNTYWLSQPLQTGFSNRHSANVRGGQGSVLFDLGANYRNTRGVMEKSGRKDWGANLNINYRTGKINFSNRAFITGATGEESPFGSFSTWVNTNPYYRLLGSDELYLADEASKNAGYNLKVANPFYNASLNSFDENKSYQINNNIQMNVDFNPTLRLSVNGQISKGLSTAKNFTSPLNTIYDGTDNFKKGQYGEANTDNFGYSGNAMLSYSRTIDKHSFTANGRTEFRENQRRLTRFSAVGFPAAATGNPSFAYGYPEGGKPTSSTRIDRSNSFLFSGNYSYDQRYNVDLSMNFDGTTAFGSNKKYQPYYAGGISWNLNNEEFLKDKEWISTLRLRGNIGVTGNQNFTNVNQSVYGYYPDINRVGQGIYLSALGAPDLDWQKTTQTSVGVDGALFNRKLTFQFNTFRKYTSPLVVAVTLPSSTGLQNYPLNAGALTANGLEFMINFSPIFKPSEQVVLTFGLSGSMTNQRYSKFNNKLESLNKQLRESNSMVRFRDGGDPRDLWAVPSMGIDPATGREVFLSKSGQYTFTYSADDQIVVGNQQPLAEGVFNTSFSYKGFTAGMIIRYILNREVMNSALYTKVENISLENVENNQDKRALYDRWKAPGDNARFKAISIVSSTPISSRFLQQENTISGESISLGYQFRNKAWIDKLGLSGLRLTGYANDIFYISTIKRERGIDYPFARSMSFSLSANFK